MKPVFLALALTACTAADDDAFDPARCDAPRTYQIDQVEIPKSSDELRAVALDLDGNGVPDNALGTASATLTRMFEAVPLDLDARAAEHLATDTEWTISIADCGETRGVAVGQPMIDMPGAVVDGRIEASGVGFVPLVALFDGTGDAWSIVTATEQTEVSLVEDGDELTGVIGFAVPGSVASPLVIHGMTRFLDAHLELGRAEVDADGDGTITELEVANNSFAQSLLGTDLVVDHVDAISLGIRIHGTR